MRPGPEALDFSGIDEGTPPPDWLVAGVIERGTVVVLSGDTTAGKSIMAAALTVAVLDGGRWLGREVDPGRVLYVDEENHRRVVADRLRALGLRSDHDEALDYFWRAGVALGTREWDDWLMRAAQEHRADLVVIDTASSTSSHDLNDNAKVAQTFRSAYRPPTRNGAAVLVLHHERKQRGSYRNASQAMLGARQWAGQADRHFAIAARGKLTEEERPDLPPGHVHGRYPIELEAPKVRDGLLPIPSRLAIVSERDADYRLVTMAVDVDDEPIKAQARDNGRRDIVSDIVAAVDGHQALRRADLAAALGLKSTDGSLDRALRLGLNEGRIAKLGHGLYGPR